MIPMRGRMIHDESGRTSLQRYGQNDSEVIYSVSRADLNKLLLTELERTASIEVQFRHNCQGLDFYSGSLSLLDERDGAVKQVAAVPVIGADGASSAIRAAMHGGWSYARHRGSAVASLQGADDPGWPRRASIAWKRTRSTSGRAAVTC